MGVILIQIVIQLRDPEGPATHHCTRLAPHSAMILAELAEPTEPAEPGSREFWARLSQLHTSPWAWRWELAQPMHALSISSFVHHYLQHPSSTAVAVLFVLHQGEPAYRAFLGKPCSAVDFCTKEGKSKHYDTAANQRATP